jgi:hypothetical protein
MPSDREMTWLSAGADRPRRWPSSQDYNQALQNPRTSFDDRELREGTAELDSMRLPKARGGNFAEVYKVQTGRAVHAVRCFRRDVPGQRERYDAISRHLMAVRVPQLVEFRYLEHGIRIQGAWYPILKMDWIEGTTLATYVGEHLNDRARIRRLAERFVDLLGALDEGRIAHGDLQHGNLLVVDDRGGPNLRLIDYDGMWVPTLDGQPSTERGHENYQHPSRTFRDFGPSLDSFSAWVILTSLIGLAAEPGLWMAIRPANADDRLLLGKADFSRPESSRGFNLLLRAQDARVKAAAERLVTCCPPSDHVLGLPRPTAEDLAGGQAVRWLPHGFAPAIRKAWWRASGQDRTAEPRKEGGSSTIGDPLAAPPAAAAAALKEARRTRVESPPAPGGAAAVRDGRSARELARPEIPSPFEQPAQVSSVFAGPPPTPIAGQRMSLYQQGASTVPGSVPIAGGDPAAGVFGAASAGSAAAPARRGYRLPPMTLLEDAGQRASNAGMDHARNAKIIEGKLASFNIPSRVIRWNAGPVVTQYEVEPDPSIKMSRIEALSDDLAMALAARTIRIEAPIPGKTVVGLEIPNMDFNVVTIRRILEDPEVAAIPSKIAFALGRDVAGHARAADLAKMPHLLIAGATGSGKSVMVNALIMSLLMRATPDEVRMILVDTSRVELADYNGMPHLLVPLITGADHAIAALKWAVGEMEMRFRKFAGATARNIDSYNATRVDQADRLPYIVIIVDELAGLMMSDGRTVEDPIVQLARKSRATGIHLVISTQRPSVNVVTGLIKANFPSRIAFAMASQIDSRTILDAPGAEDLIGRGDMLFRPSDLPRPIRLQGVFVADREIRAVTSHWRAEAEPHYNLGIIQVEAEPVSPADDFFLDPEADRLLHDAVSVVQEYDRASASLLQRRLKIGYARAARIIDQLEARGYIGAFDGSNARPVLRRHPGVLPTDVDDRGQR